MTLHLLNVSGPFFSFAMLPFSFIFVKLPPFPGYVFYRSCETLAELSKCEDPINIFLMRIFSSSASFIAMFAQSVLGITVLFEILMYLVSIISFTKSLVTPSSSQSMSWTTLVALRKYQQLRILDIAFNSIYAKPMLATLAVVQILAIVIGYCILKLHKLYSSIEISGFVIVALNIYVVVTVILTLAGKVLFHSKEVNAQLKNNAGRSCNPFLRKLSGSLKPLKVMLGSVNFVDSSTPLIVMSFCVEQTISLTLMYY